MRGGPLGLGLFLAALLVHFGLGWPAQREAIRAQEDVLRLRKEGRALAARLARLDHERELRARATRMDLPASAGPSADDVTRLRLSLLDALAGQPVSGVRLTVGPGQAPHAAEGHLRAAGTFPELVRLSGRLVAPGRGFLLRRARFTAPPSGGNLVLEVEGFSVGSGGS